MQTASDLMKLWRTCASLNEFWQQNKFMGIIPAICHVRDNSVSFQ